MKKNGGHRYEYLKNLYDKACGFTDRCTIFVVPYDRRLKTWNIDGQDSVIVDFLSDNDLKALNQQNLLKAAFRRSKLVCRYVCKY